MTPMALITLLIPLPSLTIHVYVLLALELLFLLFISIATKSNAHRPFKHFISTRISYIMHVLAHNNYDGPCLHNTLLAYKNSVEFQS